MEDWERTHPRYGPCDGYGPGETCSQCTGKIERIDGAVVDLCGNVVKLAPLWRRMKVAWEVLRRG